MYLFKMTTLGPNTLPTGSLAAMEPVGRVFGPTFAILNRYIKLTYRVKMESRHLRIKPTIICIIRRM